MQLLLCSDSRWRRAREGIRRGRWRRPCHGGHKRKRGSARAQRASLGRPDASATEPAAFLRPTLVLKLVQHFLMFIYSRDSGVTATFYLRGRNAN